MNNTTVASKALSLSKLSRFHGGVASKALRFGQELK
jgi:hypothetical protein